MLWWWLAGAAALVAVVAGLADRHRARRDDLDRIGLLDWRSIQMFALIAIALCVIVAQHG